MKPSCRASGWGWVFALAWAMFASPAPATAPIVVYNSFGPGNSYNTGIVWGITGASTSYGYRGQAEFFVPSASGNLSSITLPTYRQSGSGRSNFFVAEDNGFSPGAILESFLNTANNAHGLLTLSSVSQPLLTAGARYWLGFHLLQHPLVFGKHRFREGHREQAAHPCLDTPMRLMPPEDARHQDARIQTVGFTSGALCATPGQQ